MDVSQRPHADVPARPDLEGFLRWLAVDPALASAANPIDVVMQEMARVLGVDWAYTGEIRKAPPASIRTVAWWRDGRLHEPVEYPVAGSPCEPVCAGHASCCPSGIVRKYPSTAIQSSEGIEAYAAHPLRMASDSPIGLVAVMSRRPFEDPRRIERFLAACAPRVAGELWRVLGRGADRDRAGPVHVPEPRDPVQDRERLLREVHQQVKGNLQIVTSLLVMQGGTSDDPQLRQALAEAASRLSAIGLVHGQLAESPSSRAVDMKRFVEQVADNLQRTFDPLRTRVTITLAIDPLMLPLSLAVPCGLLIAELITNAFRHAYSHTRRGVIEVRIGSTVGEVTLVVRDDGRSLSSEGPNALGLRLVRMLATRQLAGELSTDRPEGAAFTVRFPYRDGEQASAV